MKQRRHSGSLFHAVLWGVFLGGEGEEVWSMAKKVEAAKRHNYK